MPAARRRTRLAGRGVVRFDAVRDAFGLQLDRLRERDVADLNSGVVDTLARANPGLDGATAPVSQFGDFREGCRLPCRNLHSCRRVDGGASAIVVTPSIRKRLAFRTARRSISLLLLAQGAAWA